MDTKSVALGVVAGVGLGYFVAKKTLEERYLMIANREVEEAKKFYMALYTPEGVDKEEVEAAVKGIEEAASDAAASMQEYQGMDVEPMVLAKEMVEAVKRDTIVEVDEPEVVRPERPIKPAVPMPLEPKVKIEYNKKSTIVEEKEADPVENFPTQNAETLKAPYQISFEVFDDPEDEYEKVSLSYFKGDGVVVDETDEVITPRRVQETITKSILENFDSTEDDPNVIYVRNEKLNMDFEVTRSPNTYTVEVLGQKE